MALPTRDPRLARGGFALPWTIFVLALIGVIAGTGFVISWLELRSAHTHVVGVDAFDAAEAGLATVLAQAGRPAGAAVRVVIGAAAADVAFETLLELPGGGALVSVASTAAAIDRGVPASRTVGLVAWMGPPPVFGAAVAATGSVTVGTATGTVDGDPPLSCPGPAAAGVAAGGAIATGSLVVTGAPPISRLSPGAGPTVLTGLRWPDLASGAIAPPDAAVPPDAWPSGGAAWPYVRMTDRGPLGPAHSGQGVIVADGDLDLADGFAWRGLILAGGSLRLLGDAAIDGAVFAGLDPTRSGAVDLGSGALAIRFDRCAADGAAQRLEPYPAVIRGTWYERW